MAIRPTHELRLAEALLAEAYCQERAFEFRLPAAAYLVRLCQRQEGAVSASVLIALGVRVLLRPSLQRPQLPTWTTTRALVQLSLVQVLSRGE